MDVATEVGRVDAMIDKSKRAGGILRSILHAKQCVAGSDCSDTTGNCPGLKKLLRHCLECRLSAETTSACKTAGCKTVRALLDHMLCCSAASDLARSQGKPLVGCILCTVAGVDKFRAQLGAASLTQTLGARTISTTDKGLQTNGSISYSGSSSCDSRSSGVTTTGLEEAMSTSMSSSSSNGSLGSLGSVGSFSSLADSNSSGGLFNFGSPSSSAGSVGSFGSSSFATHARSSGIAFRGGGTDQPDESEEGEEPAIIATFRPSWLSLDDRPLCEATRPRQRGR